MRLRPCNRSRKQNRAASRRHTDIRIQIAQALTSGLGCDEPNYDAVGARIAQLGNAENEYWGIEHGYRYHQSPVIAHEAEEPPFDPMKYLPTTWPGARLPHVFLKDGGALYDRLGLEFTLLAFGSAETDPLKEANEKCGLPLRIVRVAEPNLDHIFERQLLLVRSDQHIAWRGKHRFRWRDAARVNAVPGLSILAR